MPSIRDRSEHANTSSGWLRNKAKRGPLEGVARYHNTSVISSDAFRGNMCTHTAVVLFVASWRTRTSHRQKVAKCSESWCGCRSKSRSLLASDYWRSSRYLESCTSGRDVAASGRTLYTTSWIFVRICWKDGLVTIHFLNGSRILQNRLCAIRLHTDPKALYKCVQAKPRPLDKTSGTYFRPHCILIVIDTWPLSRTILSAHSPRYQTPVYI